MAKGIYVGVETDTSLVHITSTNISQYFTVAYGGTYQFVGDTNGVFTSNNGGIGTSTALTILTARKDCDISFDYSYSSEANYDKFTLKVNEIVIENEVSGATTTKSYSGVLSAGQRIVFQYKKDSTQNRYDDKCTFSNMVVSIHENKELKGIARKIQKAYIGIDGIAHKIKKAYIGVDGIAKLIFSGNVFGSYTGDYNAYPEYQYNKYNEEILFDVYEITDSGTLVLNDEAEFWMCGGGGPGGIGGNDGSSIRGGFGGCGGYVTSGTLPAGTYRIAIGAAEGTTYIYKSSLSSYLHKADAGDWRVNDYCGYGGSGGGGPTVVNYWYDDNDGADVLDLDNISNSAGGYGEGISTRPFDQIGLDPACAGGGGGGFGIGHEEDWEFGSAWDGGAGGSDGSDGYSDDGPYGGYYGGGQGSGASNIEDAFYGSDDYEGWLTGFDADWYGGAGGGGGALVITSSSSDTTLSSASEHYGSGGNGYQGVLYIRIPK